MKVGFEAGSSYIEIDVDYKIYPGRPQTREDPEEPAELEVLGIEVLRVTTDANDYTGKQLRLRNQYATWEAVAQAWVDKEEETGEYLLDLLGEDAAEEDW